MDTEPSSCCSTFSTPPGCVTSTADAHLPSSAPITTAVQHPVPHPNVSPVPLSHSRMRICSGSTTWANVTLVRLGKHDACSSRGPYVSRSTASTSSTKITVWGLPQERDDAVKVRSHACTGCSRNLSPSVSTGILAGSKTGFPI